MPTGTAAAPFPGAVLRRGEICVVSNAYRLLELLYRGGMGAVYRAYDERLRRDVALKVLLRCDDDLLQRFFREQELTARLDHPGVIRILGSGFLAAGAESLPFYAMPLIRGLNLEQAVRGCERPGAEGDRLRRRFTLRRRVDILSQACRILQCLHDRDVVHRDVKPANLLLGPYDELVLIDLGLAKEVGPSASETGRFTLRLMKELSATDAGRTNDAVIGTLEYMAPEQCLAPSTLDARADVFGLGGILYFLLTGRFPRYEEPEPDFAVLKQRQRHLAAAIGDRPRSGATPELRTLFEERDEVEGLLAGSPYHRFRAALRTRELVPPGGLMQVDPALDALCRKALAKKPEDRFENCFEMEQALRAWLRDAGPDLETS